MLVTCRCDMLSSWNWNAIKMLTYSLCSLKSSPPGNFKGPPGLKRQVRILQKLLSPSLKGDGLGAKPSGPCLTRRQVTHFNCSQAFHSRDVANTDRLGALLWTVDVANLPQGRSLNGLLILTVFTVAGNNCSICLVTAASLPVESHPL